MPFPKPTYASAVVHVMNKMGSSSDEGSKYLARVNKKIRMRFVQKVYSILFVQIACHFRHRFRVLVRGLGSAVRLGTPLAVLGFIRGKLWVPHCLGVLP